MPLKIVTIGDLIDGGYSLTACCESGRCNKSVCRLCSRFVLFQFLHGLLGQFDSPA